MSHGPCSPVITVTVHLINSPRLRRHPCRMARVAWVVIPCLPHHVTQRGNDRARALVLGGLGGQRQIMAFDDVHSSHPTGGAFRDRHRRGMRCDGRGGIGRDLRWQGRWPFSWACELVKVAQDERYRSGLRSRVVPPLMLGSSSAEARPPNRAGQNLNPKGDGRNEHLRRARYTQ